MPIAIAIATALSPNHRLGLSSLLDNNDFVQKGDDNIFCFIPISFNSVSNYSYATTYTSSFTNPSGPW